jgi:CCR4-NOT transcription complex subunit 7/8
VSFKTPNGVNYKTMKPDVDLLKIIHVGFTFMDEQGNMPPGPNTWQFNFKFSLKQNLYSLDSIGLLQAAGIDF